MTESFCWDVCEAFNRIWNGWFIILLSGLCFHFTLCIRYIRLFCEIYTVLPQNYGMRSDSLRTNYVVLKTPMVFSQTRLCNNNFIWFSLRLGGGLNLCTAFKEKGLIIWYRVERHVCKAKFVKASFPG